MDNQTKLENLGVSFIPVSSNEVVMKLPNKNYETIYCNESPKMIDKVVYEDGTIKVGDRLSSKIITNDSFFYVNYKINNMKVGKNGENEIHLLEAICNKATLFALPLIFDDRRLASFIVYEKSAYLGFLINSYVDCNFIDKKNKNSIFVLLKFSGSSRFKAQENYFFEHKHFVKHTDIDSNYVLYEFSIPTMYSNDYSLLIAGSYSKVSKKAKDAIYSFHKEDVEGVRTASILNRDPRVIQEIEKDLDVNMTGIELMSPFGESEILSKNML